MKKNRLLSAVMAAAMCIVSMCSAFNVSADDEPIYGQGDLPDFYTLEQLFEMSDEEFFELYEAESFYTEVKCDAEETVKLFDTVTYGGISGKLMVTLPDEKVKYTANVTEMEIEELLGDTVKYEIVSPISLDLKYIEENSLYYGNIFWVGFPDYDLYSQTNDITHKEIIEFAKCWYCVNQVIKVNYYHFNDVLAAAPDEEQALSGDVNLDKGVDLYDVIWIASDLIDIFKLTEGQQKVGDVNEDGVCDLYDAIAIAETLM